MFHSKFVEKLKTHILCSVTFLENRAVYGTMWNIITAEQATYDNMAHAHCKLDVLGYKLIFKIRNTYFFSTVTMVAQKRPNVAFYYLFFILMHVLNV
jgi:hypothetical protein